MEIVLSFPQCRSAALWQSVSVSVVSGGLTKSLARADAGSGWFLRELV